MYKEMSEIQHISEEKIKKPKKRKVGRPKKRGRKKKRKSRAKKIDRRHNPVSRNTIDYKIVSCHNGKQDAYIGKYKTAKDAYEALERLKEETSNVVFPKMVENRRDGKTHECFYEYLILEKNRYGDKEDPKLRNEYGVLVTNETNSDKWVVFDKLRYYVEETFWIYGLNPRTDRKTLPWIIDNLIVNPERDKHSFIRVSIYKNKVLIKDDDNNLELVLCKTQGEAVRFYNKVDELVTKDDGVIMLGSEESSKQRAKTAEQSIMDLTGWSLYKVQTRKNRK